LPFSLDLRSVGFGGMEVLSWASAPASLFICSRRLFSSSSGFVLAAVASLSPSRRAASVPFVVDLALLLLLGDAA
jgi:hypothetical protein